MDSAERKGLPLRRLLFSADRFKDAAIRLGSRDVKTPFSRVSASLCSVTWRDQRRPVRRRAAAFCPRPRRLRPALVFDAALFFVIAPPRRKPTIPPPPTRKLRPRSAAPCAPYPSR